MLQPPGELDPKGRDQQGGNAQRDDESERCMGGVLGVEKIARRRRQRAAHPEREMDQYAGAEAAPIKNHSLNATPRKPRLSVLGRTAIRLKSFFHTDKRFGR